MSLDLGKCEIDLTKEGLRLLRYRIHADLQGDAIGWRSGFKDPY